MEKIKGLEVRRLPLKPFEKVGIYVVPVAYLQSPREENLIMIFITNKS